MAHQYMSEIFHGPQKNLPAALPPPPSYILNVRSFIAFNDGLSGIIEVFNKLPIKPGTFCGKYCGFKDKKRIIQMDRKSRDSVNQRRKKIRAHCKGFQDKCEEIEGVSYKAELF